MSGEISTSIYLRCDRDMRPGERCTVTYARDRQIPNNDDGIEMLARHANRDGWRVFVHEVGFKGASMNAVCPDHAAEVQG